MRGWVLALLIVAPAALSSSAIARAGSSRLARRHAVLDALHAPGPLSVGAASASGEGAPDAVDGLELTAWAGHEGEPEWRWTSLFSTPTHIGLVRAHFGRSPTWGVPTRFRWEVREPDHGVCGADDVESGWRSLPGADQLRALDGIAIAQPTHRSWFVDADACGLRIVIDETNAGPPVVREVHAIAAARNVLRAGFASDDGAYPGFRASDAIDGTYEGRWAGAPGRTSWTLRVDLPEPMRIDRVRVVLGFDSTGVPRPGGGRTYAVTWAPAHYAIEVSGDGRRFESMSHEPLRPDGTPLPVRRRLVTFAQPRTVRALRLIMSRASGRSGLPEPGGVPVVREVEAYRADDTAPILLGPWVLSVNANPSRQTCGSPGGEAANDAFYASLLQRKLRGLLPALRRDDRYARVPPLRGEWLDGAGCAASGEALESIEGDDAELDAQLLSASSPPPIVVLSGSNDWDYSGETRPDPEHPARWHWDPLRDARWGGMGQLASSVQRRVAPFLGFCGGAQILALLEARRVDDLQDDLSTIDRIVARTSGRPVRGFASLMDLDRAWPSDPSARRPAVRFAPGDPLFADVAGPLGRSTSRAMPEWHVDAVRLDAFGRGGPLARLDVVATSDFCSPAVVAGASGPSPFSAFAGTDGCDVIPEVFRSREEDAFPVIGSQFHAEQRDFATADPGDPPESIADPVLFIAAALERVVDGYESLAP